MSKLRKVLLVLLSAIMLCCITAFAAACTDGEGTSVDGTYYLYDNGELDKSFYFTLSGSSWTDDDEMSGVFTVSNGQINLYFTEGGFRALLATGTVGNGHLSLTIGEGEYSETIDFYKEGSEPSSGSGGGGEDIPGHTHTYSADWSSDATYHWHAATCEHTTLRFEQAEHTYLNHVCTVCDYDNSSDIVQYTVTFNAGAGKFADELSSKRVRVNTGSVVSTVETPTRAGYTFNGWYTDNGTFEVRWNLTSDIVSEPITLYADWERIEHSVTFNLNYTGTSVQHRETENGLITYIPERTGFVFNGWWTSNNNGSTLLAKYDVSKEVTDEGLVLYADWIANALAGSKLATPTASVTSTGFAWLPVDNASGYEIVIRDANSNRTTHNLSASTTSYTISSSSTAGTYYLVSITATGDGINTINSTTSSPNLQYKHRYLDSITGIEFNISTSMLTWNPVSGISSYSLYIDSSTTSRNINGYKADLSDLTAGSHTVRIEAHRTGYISSEGTYPFTKVRLLSPDDFTKGVLSTTGECVISWDAVVNADSYKVTVGNNTLTTSTTSVTIPNTATYWGSLQELSVTIQAFDSDADYLISYASEPVTISKKQKLTITDTENITTGYTLESDETKGIYTDNNQSYTVSFNANGGSSTVSSQIVTRNTGLTYPTTLPTRSGYVFTGWYTTSSCTRLYDFTANVTSNTTVYAGWRQLTNSNSYADNALFTSSSNNYNSHSVYSSYYYYYFTILNSGTYSIWYANESSTSSYATAYYFYNTTQSSLIASGSTYSTTYRSYQFTAEAGDVIYLRINRSSSYNSTFYYYLTCTGNKYPTAGGVARGQYATLTTSTSDLEVVADIGAEVTLTAPATRTGYTWLGWYNGDTLLSAEKEYEYTMPASDVTLRAYWVPCTITLDRSNIYAGTVSGIGVGTLKANGDIELTLKAETTISSSSRYVWLGWYSGGDLIEDDMEYTLNMPELAQTITATWMVFPKTINANDTDAGEIEETSTGSVLGQNLVYTATPNAGYMWLGWYKSGTLYTSSRTLTIVLDTTIETYTATWAEIPVTIEKSHEAAGTITGMPTTCTVGDTITLTATTNTGYVWLGWYDGVSALNTDVDATTYTFDISQTARTITARWERSQVRVDATEGGSVTITGGSAQITSSTVNFDLNGGTSSTAIPSQTISGMQALVYPKTIPTKTDYVFTGWYTSVNCTTLYDFSANVADANITLYAGWEAMTNGGYAVDALSTSSSSNCNSHTVYSISYYYYFTILNSGTYNLYYRNGTSSSSYATAYYLYNTTQSTSIGSGVASSTLYSSRTFTAEAGDVIYLRLIRNSTYTSTFSYYLTCTGSKYPTGGTLGTAVSNVVPESSVTLTATTNAGYTWLGWYDSTDTLVTSNLTHTFTMAASDIKFSAKWAEYVITASDPVGGSIAVSGAVDRRPVVSFNLNGGTSTAIESQRVTSTSPLTYPTTIPTRTGYVFTGWYTTADCTTLYNFTASVTENTTVYAGWVAYSGAGIIYTNGTVTDSFPSKESSSLKYYAYVPLVSGTVTITSNASGDTYCYLYNSSKSRLTYDDDSGSIQNFLITYSVTAGTLYYIAPCGFSSTMTFGVTVTGTAYPTAGGTNSAVGDTYRATEGSQVTLTATADSGYTFTGWYNSSDLQTALSTDLIYTFTMEDANLNLVAKFEPIV